MAGRLVHAQAEAADRLRLRAIARQAHPARRSGKLHRRGDRPRARRAAASRHGGTPRRANYTVATVRALFNFAIKRGLGPPASNPATGIKIYRERARERFLSEAKIGAAAEAIEWAERKGKSGPSRQPGCGWRCSPAPALAKSPPSSGRTLIGSGKIIRLPDSKTNEPRTIHLSDAAIEVLKTCRASAATSSPAPSTVKPTRTCGGRGHRAQVRRPCTYVRLHELRHTYASSPPAAASSLQLIGKLLGHQVPATTARYLHFARDPVSTINDEFGAALQAGIATTARPATPATSSSCGDGDEDRHRHFPFPRVCRRQ